MFNVCFRVFRENRTKMIICTSNVHFRGLQRNIEKSTVTFRLFNDTGHLSDVEIKARTKISETVPNPGNFAGEPPLTEAQPPPAVAKNNIQNSIFLSLLIVIYFI